VRIAMQTLPTTNNTRAHRHANTAHNQQHPCASPCKHCPQPTTPVRIAMQTLPTTNNK
jgi:hypothetical protein